jgi:hypothetical protein
MRLLILAVSKGLSKKEQTLKTFEIFQFYGVKRSDIELFRKGFDKFIKKQTIIMVD